MSIPAAIKEPIAGELQRYEEYLRSALHSDNDMTATMLDYIFNNRGKSVRPIMTLLSAGIYCPGRPLPEETMLAAMLVEMVHTASLVHDDVIDEALIRRGKPSAKAMWRSHRAVLIGDYILAKSFSVGMRSGFYDLVKYLSVTMPELCEGELLQSRQSDKLEMTRDIYFEIIHKKTAVLMAVSCGSGAMSAGVPASEFEAMQEFGRNVGMAFQIQDDIIDYTSSDKTGKPEFGDIREKKITLPMLTVLERSSQTRRKELTGMLAGVVENPENIERLGNIIKEEGGLEMAASVMNGFITTAAGLLADRPETLCRDSLDLLRQYIATREA